MRYVLTSTLTDSDLLKKVITIQHIDRVSHENIHVDFDISPVTSLTPKLFTEVLNKHLIRLSKNFHNDPIRLRGKESQKPTFIFTLEATAPLMAQFRSFFPSLTAGDALMVIRDHFDLELSLKQLAPAFTKALGERFRRKFKVRKMTPDEINRLQEMLNGNM